MSLLVKQKEEKKSFLSKKRVRDVVTWFIISFHKLRVRLNRFLHNNTFFLNGKHTVAFRKTKPTTKAMQTRVKVIISLLRLSRHNQTTLQGRSKYIIKEKSAP